MGNLLYFETYGEGQGVVFLHGMVGSVRYWYNLKDLLKAKFQVILIDLLGFGRSPKNNKLHYTLEEHLTYLHKTLKQINPSQPFVLVGHSMGALLSINYAYKYPKQVKKLILIAPPVFKDPKEAKENVIAFSSFPEYFLYGKSAKIICRVFCNCLRPLTKIWIQQRFDNLPKEVAQDILLHNFNSYSKSLKNLIENQNTFKIIKYIKCPILIIYGKKDGRVILENYQKLKKLNPKIKFVAVENAEHELSLTHPEVIIERLILGVVK